MNHLISYTKKYLSFGLRIGMFGILISQGTKTVFAQKQIYLFAGQSNMTGYGSVDTLHDPKANARIRQFNPNNNTFSELKEPSGFKYLNFDRGTGSMLTSFMNVVAEKTQDSLYILKMSDDGTSTNNWMKGNTLKTIEATKRMMHLKQAKVSAIIWSQGEGDFKANSDTQYVNNTKRIFQQFRDSLDPNLEIFMIQGVFVPEMLEKSQRMMDAQGRICKELKGVYMLYEDAKNFSFKNGLKNSDDTHISQAGFNKMGQECAINYLKLKGTERVKKRK